MVERFEQITSAALQAGNNWAANCAALRRRQAGLAERLEQTWLEAEWVFGRDGALTALVQGEWWSGCSLPRRAAESVLKKLEAGAAVVCFVSPAHSAQVRFALRRMTDGQALIAVVPDDRDLRLMLGCEDFSAEFGAGRLWFVTGKDWAEDLADLFVGHEGLSTPGQFVRTNLVEAEEAEGVIRSADEVIRKENERRAELVRAILSDGSAGRRDGVLAVVGSRFRLWDNAGGMLREIAAGAGWGVVEVDDPCSASSVAFARAAARCGAVVMANASRAELPPALSHDVRVVSWVTGPRIPPFDARCPGDGLVVADGTWREAALRAGWPGSRVVVGEWPATVTEVGGGGLAIIADTTAVRAPAFEMSSHGLLWETIAGDVGADPLVVGIDAGAYLSRWCERAGVEGVDRRLFVERLILPTYQQAVAKTLIAAGVEVRLYGRGWDEVEGLSQYWGGVIGDREGLRAVLESVAGVVHVWPVTWAHPVEAAGRPVVWPGRGWVEEARRIAKGVGAPLESKQCRSNISAAVIVALLS